MQAMTGSTLIFATGLFRSGRQIPGTLIGQLPIAERIKIPSVIRNLAAIVLSQVIQAHPGTGRLHRRLTLAKGALLEFEQ
jgi:hypothetical protein